MFQIPALLFSFVVATALALGLHLWLGRGVRDLLAFWLAAVAGFACGQIAGDRLRILPWMVGQVRIVEAVLGSVLFVLAANWLRPREGKS